MSRALALLGLLAVVGGCTGADERVVCEDTFEATIEQVVDGDTLDVAGCTRIRLALVDTPERGEAGSAEASAFTAETCPEGSRATVDLDAGQPLDRTGTRLVGVLFCGGRNLNAELLAAGHAVVLREFCAVSEFADDAWAAPHCASA
ncbi:MAG TPA: thermonuclease family protein [Candidatus Thermoplasmatota archaeon]|jgi:endonuclease YncB( thermonuclease family)|nr:thermonuclease family protein [Candidatus Thermoplasmatota archaeon]